jgi:tRNA A-37 threonylcarbamoyl transferase component Bud32
MSATVRLRDGQTFGRYQIVRLIGEGGMGAVYEAIHPALKKRFAIKTLLPEIAQREEARIRFLREGEAASSIIHPHVVAVADVGTEDGIPYLVMELLEGQTLADLLAQRGSLTVGESVALLLPVISAVATGHDRGVIHRDLKPPNIFLAKGPWGDQIPKVLDFGVSKLTGDDSAPITRTLAVLGTAAYMSPEQARGAKRIDFQSDQYALGLILYEMLTGSRAHPGDNALEILHNVASGMIRPARELKPDLPHDLDAVLTRMLAATPTDRYRSLHDAGGALLRFADDRTRMAMANAFGSSTGDRRGAGAGAGADARADSAAGSSPRSDPPSGGRVGETLPLPVSSPVRAGPSDTTLREAVAEAASANRSARRPWSPSLGGAIGVTLGIVVVAGAVLWTVARMGSRQAPSSEESNGTPAGATVATPRAAGSASMPPAEMAAAPKEAAPSPVPFAIAAVPAEAEIELDDLPPTKGRLEVLLPLAGASHELHVSADGYLSKDITFRRGEQPPAEIRLDRDPTAAAPQAAERRAAGSDAAATSRLGAPKQQPPPLPRPVRASPPVTRATRAGGPANPAKASRPSKAIERPNDAEVAAPTPKRGSNNALILK